MKIPNLWQLQSLHGNLGGFVGFAVPSGKHHVNSDIAKYKP